MFFSNSSLRLNTAEIMEIYKYTYIYKRISVHIIVVFFLLKFKIF
jgi:hypothetical protein